MSRHCINAYVTGKLRNWAFYTKPDQVFYTMLDSVFYTKLNQVFHAMSDRVFHTMPDQVFYTMPRYSIDCLDVFLGILWNT